MAVAGAHLVLGSLQIDVQGIKGRHGHLGAPVFHFVFRPASVQADGAGDVFRERMAEIALADEDVADEPAGVHVENAAA